MRKTKAEMQRDRAIRLMAYPLQEGLRCGAYSQDEYNERWREGMQIIDECHPIKAPNKRKASE